MSDNGALSMRLCASIRGFVFGTSATALIEFAIALPVLLVLILGGIEVTRYVQANQKATIAAFTTADLITQYNELTCEEIRQFAMSAQFVMKPFPATAANMVVIVTSMSLTLPNPVTTNLQISWPAGRTGLSRVSAGVGSVPTIAGYPWQDRDQLISVEVLYTYNSMLSLTFINSIVPSEEEFYKASFTRPRFGALLGC